MLRRADLVGRGVEASSRRGRRSQLLRRALCTLWWAESSLDPLFVYRKVGGTSRVALHAPALVPCDDESVNRTRAGRPLAVAYRVDERSRAAAGRA